jgi:hypothetical protein
MRNRIPMPVRSKFRPVATKVERVEDALVRKYMDLYGCNIKEARQMLSILELKTKMSKPELYAIHQG